MSETGFSTELEEFIAAEIQSLEQLEILLLLSGNPHRWWTSQSVYEVVKSSLASVEDRLNEMAGRGLLKRETTPAACAARAVPVNQSSCDGAC